MKTVLVADDEDSMRKILEKRLAASGYAVLTAQDGAIALQLAKERKPDVILLDVMMPGIEGLEACRRLKAAPETAKIPVVIVSAKESKGFRQEVMAAGADALVQKPYEFRELVKLIGDLTGGPTVPPTAPPPP